MEIYEAQFRFRPDPQEPIERAHRRIKDAFCRLDAPWGYRDQEFPECPDIGDDLGVTVELGKLSGRGRNSYLSYSRRDKKYLRDKAQYDDFIVVAFRNKDVDAHYLVDAVFPLCITDLGCYRATVYNEELAMRDWDDVVEACNSTGRDADGRDGVFRINAINYYDRELCRRAFRRTPEDIAGRLEGEIEHVSVLNDGVLLIYKSELLGAEECEKIDSEVRRLLA